MSSPELKPVTEAVLAELDRIEKAATPGDWEFENSHEGEPYNLQKPVELNGRRVHPAVLLKTLEGWAPSQEDAAVIVAARNALPHLLAEIRRLRSMIVAARKTLEELVNCIRHNPAGDALLLDCLDEDYRKRIGEDNDERSDDQPG